MGWAGSPSEIKLIKTLSQVRLNMRARNAANMRTTRRMKIPDNLSKVTKV